jgi:hypothetical protein
MEPTFQLRKLMPGKPAITELSAVALDTHKTIAQLRESLATNRPAQRIGDGIISAIWMGIITDHGPTPAPDDPNADDPDADDTTQPRYWVKLISPKPTLNAGDLFDGEIRTEPGIARTVRATNLNEIIRAGHSLATDETVIVVMWRVVYQTSPTTAHWIFDRGTGISAVNGDDWDGRIRDIGYIRIPDENGTSNVLEFADGDFTDDATPTPADHSGGADIQFKSPTKDFQVITSNNGLWTIDYPRLNDNT